MSLLVLRLLFLACIAFLFFKLIRNLFEAKVDIDQRFLVIDLVLMIFLIDLILLVLLALTFSFQVDVNETCCSFFYLFYRRPLHLLQLSLFIVVLELLEVEFIMFFLRKLLMFFSTIIDILSVGIHLLYKIRKQSYCFFPWYIYPSNLFVMFLYLTISILWRGVWIAFSWDICFEVAILHKQSILWLWLCLIKIEKSG